MTSSMITDESVMDALVDRLVVTPCTDITAGDSGRLALTCKGLYRRCRERAAELAGEYTRQKNSSDGVCKECLRPLPEVYFRIRGGILARICSPCYGAGFRAPLTQPEAIRIVLESLPETTEKRARWFVHCHATQQTYCLGKTEKRGWMERELRAQMGKIRQPDDYESWCFFDYMIEPGSRKLRRSWQ